MSQLVFDIYDGAAPVGARLVRLTNQDYAMGTFLRTELNGTGSGKVVIHGSHASVTPTNFARGNYVVGADLDLSRLLTLATSSAADNKVDLSAAHGLALYDRVEFTALTGGAGLAINTPYWVVNVPTSTEVQLGLTKGGGVIDFTTNITAGTMRVLEDVAGFFLTEGDFKAVSARGTSDEVLSFGGPGSLAYFGRAEWWKSTFSGSVATTVQKTKRLAISRDALVSFRDELGGINLGAGVDKHLPVGRGPGSPYYVRSLLGFALDFSDVSQIVSATLHLYRSAVHGTIASPDFYIKRCTSAWAEGIKGSQLTAGGVELWWAVNAVNWGNQPSTTSTDHVHATAAAAGWNSYDVTNLVKAWAPAAIGGGANADHGLMLKQTATNSSATDETGTMYAEFQSRENSYDPYIELVYATTTITSDGPKDDGQWHFPDTPLGKILKRMIDEAQAAARPSHPIPDLTYDFSATVDSAGEDWAPADGENTYRVGTNYLNTVADFMRGGLTIVMKPNLALRAFQNEYGSDRTTDVFAAGKVRFERDVNIAEDAVQAVHETSAVSHLLVSGSSSDPAKVVLVTDAGATVVKEGSLAYPQSDDPAALASAGQADLRRRKAAKATARITHVPGDDDLTGAYTPGWPGHRGHYWLGDTVTVDTGTRVYDFNEQDLLVAAIRWQLRVGGDWAIVDELGASYYSVSQPGVSIGADIGTHTHAPNPPLCDPEFGFVETDGSWKVWNTLGVSPPAGWNQVGFDDSAWAFAFDVEGGVYPAGLTMDSEAGVPVVPSDEILLRREFYVDEADLSGAAVVLKYAADNGGRFYVNGVEIASLTPLFAGVPTSHYDTDHATTLARSAFQAGLNCVAIYVANDSAGTPGNIPPGATRGGIYIEMPVHNLDGTDGHAARCDHHHRHADILGRDAPEQHPASAVSEVTDGDVQTAIDNLRAGAASMVDDIREELHGLFIATYHRASDELPILMTSLDGVTWDDVGPLLGATTVRDPSIIHWDGAYWMIATKGAVTSFKLYRTPDLSVPWTEIATVTADGSGTNVWAPEWIRNMDGTPYLHPSTGLPCATVNVSTNSQTTFTVRELHPTNRAMTSWSAATTITGTGLPTKMIDAFLMVDGTDYWLWFKNEGANKRIELATSSTALTSGYTVLESGDWAGWYAARDGGANSIEGPCVIRLEDGRWRIYFNENNGFTSIRAVYSETTDDWRTGTSTWTTQAVIATDALMSHGSVVYIPGVYDHQRDPDAHPGNATAADLAAHLVDTADAHDASAVSIADAGGYYTGAEVEAALQEAAVRPASEVPFTPNGSIAATDVQAAIQEVRDEASGVAALDDLTDVTLTSPASAEHLRFDGSVWVNSPRVWMPLTTVVGGVPELVWDADDSLIPTEVAI